MAETGARTRRSRRRALTLVVATLAVVVVLIVLAGGLGSLGVPAGPDEFSAPAARGRASRALRESDDPPPPIPDGPTVVIHGRVVAAGTFGPIAGARVIVKNPRGTRESVTDTDGAWRMTIPVPRWRRGERTLWSYDWTSVSAEADGYLTAGRNLTIPGETATWTAPPLVLTPAAATVSGRVVDPEGRGIAGARIGIRKAVSGERRATSVWIAPRTTTDDQGRFGPEPVPSGHLHVGAGGYGWRGLSRSIIVRRRSPPEKASVELVLSRLPRVSGCVVDETGRPIPGAMFRYPYRGVVVEVTDEKGRFAWPLENSFDSVKVRPEKPGYIDLKFGQRISHHADNRLVLHRAAPVVGRVVDHESRPAEGIVVSAWFEIADSHQDITNASGRFRIEDVRLGSIELRLRRHGIDLARLPVDLAPGGGEHVLRLPPPRAITVTVLDAGTGRPLEGATLVGPNARDLASTGPAGRAVLSHGDPAWLWHVLKIRHPGYATASLPLSKEVAESTRTVSLMPLVPTTVVVRSSEGEPVEGAVVTWRGEWPLRDRMETTSADGTVVIDLPPDAGPVLEVDHPEFGTGRVSLSPSGARDRVEVSLALRKDPAPEPDPDDEEPGEITGTVVDAAGRPVPGVTIAADSRDALTDGLGRFRIGGVHPGHTQLLLLSHSPEFGSICRVWATEGRNDLRIVVPGMVTVRLPGEGGPHGIGVGTAWLLDQRDPETGYVIRFEIPWRQVDGETRAAIPAGPVLLNVWTLEGVLVSRPTLVVGKEHILVLRPDAPHSLRGVVLDGDGRGAKNAKLIDPITGESVAKTDDQGKIVPTVDLLPTLGPLQVFLDGHAPKLTESVDLARGADLIIHMTRGGTVRVSVRDAQGRRVHRVVRLHRDLGRHGRWRGSGTTSALTFTHVPAGLRRFEVSVLGGRPVIGEVYVIEGATADLDLVVPEGAR